MKNLLRLLPLVAVMLFAIAEPAMARSGVGARGSHHAYSTRVRIPASGAIRPQRTKLRIQRQRMARAPRIPVNHHMFVAQTRSASYRSIRRF